MEALVYYAEGFTYCVYDSVMLIKCLMLNDKALKIAIIGR